MPGIYFEIIRQGAYVKVAAIDAESGLEASIIGPIGTPQPELEKLALKKLEFVRRRSAGQPNEAKTKTGPGRLA